MLLSCGKVRGINITWGRGEYGIIAYGYYSGVKSDVQKNTTSTLKTHL